MADFIQGLTAVGSFGLITDIVASESPWRNIEFLAKPAVIQDAFKLYDAMLRIGSDMIGAWAQCCNRTKSSKIYCSCFWNWAKESS